MADDRKDHPEWYDEYGNPNELWIHPFYRNKIGIVEEIVLDRNGNVLFDPKYGWANLSNYGRHNRESTALLQRQRALEMGEYGYFPGNWYTHSSRVFEYQEIGEGRFDWVDIGWHVHHDVDSYECRSKHRACRVDPPKHVMWVKEVSE